MSWKHRHDEDKACVTLVIFSAPPKLRDRFKRIWDVEPTKILEDPFSLLVICLDELWLQSQSIVKIVGDEFSRMERVSQFERLKDPPRAI